MRGWDADRIARASGAGLVHRPGPGEGAGPSGPLNPPESSGPVGPVGVSIDSRALAPGELFVGLAGENADGGEYAAQALQAGAWGVLVAPEHALAAAAIAQAAGAGAAAGAGTALGAGIAAGLDGSRGGASSGGDGVVLAHPDPLAGLQALAKAWLGELRSEGARVVAITGSTGKTSTKDILAALLAPHLRTFASPANFNTEIGLPLTILAAPAGAQALVLELAMRGKGQIAELTKIAEPDVGVIVNVGPVHLQLLGTLEAVAAAKAELISGLVPGATAVVPAREPLLMPYLREDVRTITFGERAEGAVGAEGIGVAGVGEGAEHVESAESAGGAGRARGGGVGERAEHVERADVELVERRGADGSVVICHDGGEEIVLEPSFGQAHNLRNLLAAVAAARALGVTPEGEVTVRFSALRGERIQLSKGIVLIDDCYNANPMSMRAAIDDLAEATAGRRVAVLGDMLELGPGERRFHSEIGAHAARRGVDVLVTVGPLAAEMAGAFTGARAGGSEGKVRSVADAPAAAEMLRGLLAPGDTVLVKASRGVGLERVGQALLARDPVLAPPPAASQAGRGGAQAGPGGVRTGPDGAPAKKPGGAQASSERPQAGRR